jgi:primosomal protein N'
VCFLLIWRYLLRHRDLLRHSISEGQARQALRRAATGSVAYLAGAAVAIVSPAVGLTLFVLIALY